MIWNVNGNKMCAKNISRYSWENNIKMQYRSIHSMFQEIMAKMSVSETKEVIYWEEISILLYSFGKIHRK